MASRGLISITTTGTLACGHAFHYSFEFGEKPPLQGGIAWCWPCRRNRLIVMSGQQPARAEQPGSDTAR